MLADAVSEGLDYTPQYIYDRHDMHQKRAKAEIGFSSIRGGTIVGEHEVIFAGHDEIVTITHTAMSKEIFAVGALNAALFLAGQPAGFYNMKDFIGQCAKGCPKGYSLYNPNGRKRLLYLGKTALWKNPQSRFSIGCAE